MDFRNQYEGLLFRAAKLLQYPQKLHFGHEPSGPRPNLTPARIWTVQSANFYRISNVYYDEACAEFDPLYILMWVYSNVRQCQQFVNQPKQSSLLKIQGFCVKTRDKILAMLWSTHCQEHIFINSVSESPANQQLQRVFLPVHCSFGRETGWSKSDRLAFISSSLIVDECHLAAPDLWDYYIDSFFRELVRYSHYCFCIQLSTKLATWSTLKMSRSILRDPRAAGPAI